MPIDLSRIHPDLRSAAKRLPRIVFTRRNLWLIRLLIKLMARPHHPADVTIENHFIPRDGESKRLRLRLYRARTATAPQPALLWFHGGGYIGGTPELDEANLIRYVREMGLHIISVEYRLAPEHPFPAGLNDGYTTLRWVRANATTLNINTERIAVGGASAGAGLAAALAQLAYDRREVPLMFQLLIYPMLDERTVARTDLAGRDFLGWDPASNRFAWEAYLGGAGSLPKARPYSVPARRADLTGLPPAWIGVGTLDLFHDEDVAYAQRLRASGVPCEICIVPGAYHGFDFAGQELPLIREFQKAQITALKKYLMV